MRWIILILLIGAVYYLYARGYLTPESALSGLAQSLRETWEQFVHFFSALIPQRAA